MPRLVLLIEFFNSQAVFKTTALSDEEFSAFKCRPGTFYQYGKGDGDGNGAIEWNEYASAENGWAGCFPDQNLPCYRTDNQCEMETDTFTANNGFVRHVFSMNSIPDHHAWGMSGKELQTELKILAGNF